MSETRSKVQRIVDAILVDEHGPEAMTRAPISSTISFEVPRPRNYLDGIKAAQRASWAADAIARDYAKKARAEGASWTDVATSLDYTDETHDDPAMAAFYWVAPNPSQRFDPIRTSWECASCHERVSDSGPHGGHPDDVEEGHTADCARHAADIAAWRAATGWDED